MQSVPFFFSLGSLSLFAQAHAIALHDADRTGKLAAFFF